MNGMLIYEYNLVEPNNHYQEQKVPEYIETKIKVINKKILSEVLVHHTANKIIELNSILGDDIEQIFKSNNLEDKNEPLLN